MGFRERTGMNTGQIVSAVGHVCLLLWVAIGDWLFTAKEMPEVTVAEVSLMTSSEFDAMILDKARANGAEIREETTARELIWENGAVVGVRNLGYLFLDGFQRRIPEEIGTGLLAVFVIAMAFDLGLWLLGRALTPWRTRGGHGA